MAEKIEPTWLAYALERSPSPDALAAGIARLRSHYDELVDYPTTAHSAAAGQLGLVVLEDTDPRCRWPHFAEEADVAVGTAYVPTGWEAIVGDREPADAPLPLARRLLGRPGDLAAALAAPFALAALDRGAGRLVIANDCIGAARLLELRFPGGVVWSNRAAAPLLFAGIEPQASRRGWRMLAAATWLIGDATPFEGVRKVDPGTVVEAGPEGVETRATDAVGPLVRPGRLRLEEAVESACEAAVREARAAGAVWPGAADVDLSGGRDSRTVAAACVASGIEVSFNTSDVTPGEADVARELVAALPRPVGHDVRKSDARAAKQLKRPVLKRALNSQLLHDAMRHPQKIRQRQQLPRSRPEGATLSGHGGEIAHGFFYKTPRELWRIRLGGRRAAQARLERLFAKGHSAARDECYEEAAAEVDRVLGEGSRLGVRGPTLLEWFYLVDRFANKSGISAHAERVSIFGTPGFVRASFALTPRQRIDAILHREMVARLVPEWREVPYFKAERRRVRRIRRMRLWEAPEDAETIEEIIGGDGPWTELYDPDRVRGAWREVRSGGGFGNWEGIFEGIAFRQAFEDYLAILRERAAQGPSLT